MRSILVTGCSSGIGYSTAHTLAKLGWRVFATCRKSEDCERLSREGLRSLRLDYEDQASIESAFASVVSETGGTLDAVFNNGAYCIPGSVEDISTQALQAIFQANFFGWHHLTSLALPIMRAQGHGRVLQNSSIGGFLALKYRGSYIATKFALEGLTHTLRLELRGTNIQVILIEPGPVNTPIRANSYANFKKWVDWEQSPRRAEYEHTVIPRLESPSRTAFEVQPEAVVRKVITALTAAKPKPRYFVTIPTHIGGIAHRLLPTALLDRFVCAAWN